jgi:hypothetical protein
MKLVEKMAKAMCEEDCVTCPQRTDTEWDQESAFYLSFARAALKAMREPTEAMTKAIAVARKPTPIPAALADLIWHTMIDAAIAEAETP